jgi:methionine sulfoxide reductase heme-binding subunit
LIYTIDGVEMQSIQGIFRQKPNTVVAARATKKTRFSALQVVAHLGAWIPLALLIWDWRTGNLTANPIQDATQRMGRAAILLLMVVLSVTPFQTLTGIRQVQKLARPLGLYAFFYALVHLFLYVGVDYGFDLSLLLPDIANKQYIYIGASAFLILIALAVTSFRWWMKRMGKRWKRLHRLVYAAGVLVVIHYSLAVKGDLLHLRGNIGWPVFYGVLVILLLGLRIPVVRRKVVIVRQRVLDRVW